MPRQGKKLPTAILTVGEISRILAACETDTWIGIRDRAILELFYSTGIRRTELAHLHVGDLDFDAGTAMVRQGKGKKDQVVPVGDRALYWLSKYLLKVRSPQVGGKDPSNLFLTQTGTEITPETLTALVGKYLDKAGIDAQGGPQVVSQIFRKFVWGGCPTVR